MIDSPEVLEKYNELCQQYNTVKPSCGLGCPDFILQRKKKQSTSLANRKRKRKQKKQQQKQIGMMNIFERAKRCKRVSPKEKSQEAAKIQKVAEPPKEAPRKRKKFTSMADWVGKKKRKN